MRWVQVDELIAGEVGYLAASIKAVADARVGDTITLKRDQAAEALAGLCRLHLLCFSHFKSWSAAPMPAADTAGQRPTYHSVGIVALQ